VKKNVKNDHQKWTDDKTEKAKAATNRGDVKELYNITKLLAKKKFNSSGLVRNKEGLLKATEREREQLRRRKEYFNEIPNQGLESQEPKLGATETDESVVESDPSIGT
jgi:hypothetical protein